jgi:hypothetical protein
VCVRPAAFKNKGVSHREAFDSTVEVSKQEEIIKEKFNMTVW